MSDDPNLLSKRTTPTWEIELLISGALVFSLLKLPNVLDAAILQILPSLQSELVVGLNLVSVYLRAALVTLAVAFVIHLILRAYWVALVGVNSVYPEGPRWERAKSGVHTRMQQQRNWVPLEVRIESFDNAASLVFAAGVGMGVFMVSLSILAGSLLLLSTLLGHYLVLSLSMQTWLIVLLSVALFPAFFAGGIDYFFGSRISPDGRLGRFIGVLLSMSEYFPGFRQFNAIAQTIGLNLPKRAPFSLLLFALMTSTFFISEMSNTRSIREPRMRIMSMQQNLPLASKPEHYRDQRRGTQKFFAVPTIASRELGDSALELFVSLRADRHPAAFMKNCPELAALAHAQEATLDHDRAWLHCAAQVFTPTLDGVTLDASDLLYTVDAQSGLEGLLLRVPNSAFTSGKHVIGVQNIANADKSPPLPPFQIVVFR